MPVRDFHNWFKFAFKLLVSDQWDVISERVENGDQCWRWVKEQLVAALKDMEKNAWQKPVGNAAFTLSEQLLIRFRSPMLNDEEYLGAQHFLKREAGLFALRDDSTPVDQRVNGAKLGLLEGTLVHFDKPEFAGSAICNVFTNLCDVEAVVDAIYENKDAQLAAEVKVMFDCSKEYAEIMKLPIDDLVELEFDPSCLPSDPPAPFKPPDIWVFGDNGLEDGFLSIPEKVLVDQEGNFLVMEQDTIGVNVETVQRIQLFNPLGKFIKVVLKRGEGKVNGMCDFCLNKDGNLVVVDEDDNGKSRIQVFDYDANQLMIMNDIGKDDPQVDASVTHTYVDDEGKTVSMINNPDMEASIRGVYVDDDGNMICVDKGKTCIRIYGPDGKLKIKFGEWGKGESQFLSILQATAQGGKIYAINLGETGYNTLVFNYNGEFLYKFAPSSKHWYLEFDEKNQHFYAIQDDHSIVILGLDGTVTDKTGGHLGSGLEESWSPRSVVVLEDGRIAVADSMNHRIKVFKF